jgi:hypothetical protein
MLTFTEMPEAVLRTTALLALTAAVLLLKLPLPLLLVLACAQKTPMVPILTLALLALVTPPRLLDPLPKLLACARLTSTEMPEAVLRTTAKLVLMVEQLMVLKHQEPPSPLLLACALPASMETAPPAQLVVLVPPLLAEH